VPTPFYHLSLAEELVNHPRMPGPISQFLQTYRSEFLFGSTAPDVQVVSGQMREETHFFDLPIQTGDPPAWEACLTKYPYLAASVRRETAHAAFLAGYLCHLQADWIWVNDIFTPTFGNHAAWGTFRQRLYYHNVLRAYLDLRTLPELPIDTGARLDQVESDGWLPFLRMNPWQSGETCLHSNYYQAQLYKRWACFFRQGISAPGVKLSWHLKNVCNRNFPASFIGAGK
jgi:hypothetical protein